MTERRYHRRAGPGNTFRCRGPMRTLFVGAMSTIDNVPASMDRLRAVFNPTEAAGVTARILFVVSGAETQHGTVEIPDGRWPAHQGQDKDPTVTLRIPEGEGLAIGPG